MIGILCERDELSDLVRVYLIRYYIIVIARCSVKTACVSLEQSLRCVKISYVAFLYPYDYLIVVFREGGRIDSVGRVYRIGQRLVLDIVVRALAGTVFADIVEDLAVLGGLLNILDAYASYSCLFSLFGELCLKAQSLAVISLLLTRCQTLKASVIMRVDNNSGLDRLKHGAYLYRALDRLSLCSVIIVYCHIRDLVVLEVDIVKTGELVYHVLSHIDDRARAVLCRLRDPLCFYNIALIVLDYRLYRLQPEPRRLICRGDRKVFISPCGV